jgi:hypothetical protein
MLKLFNDDKHFIVWGNPASVSPNILRAQDFSRIVASNQHFARKFDISVDAEVLDELDRHIGIRT